MHRAYREIEAMKKLGCHQHICHLYQVAETEENIYLVMEVRSFNLHAMFTSATMACAPPPPPPHTHTFVGILINKMVLEMSKFIIYEFVNK